MMTLKPRVSLLAPDPAIASRNAAEKRFRAYGLTAIILALLALVWLLISIFFQRFARLSPDLHHLSGDAGSGDL